MVLGRWSLANTAPAVWKRTPTTNDQRPTTVLRRLMSILVVGSVAFDTIATPSGRVSDILGGAATYFALAASYFTEVRMVAAGGEDFTSEHEAGRKERGRGTRGM